MKQTFTKTPNLYRCFTQALVIFCSLTVSLSPANAASLGKMKVLSALGATFKAEIELNNIKPDEESNLVARLSPPEVFKQAGIDYNPALANIRVNLVKDGNLTSITLSSSSTVNEPILEVLIELSWQSGRLVRQYTVLLDPISSIEESAAPVNQVQVPAPLVGVKAPEGALESAPAARTTTSATDDQKIQESTPKSATNSTYGVQKGDTLYGIASRLNAGDSSQINALMTLLLKNNPHAFIGNNLNKLKAGVVLNTTNSVNSSIAVDNSLTNRPTSKAFSNYKQIAVNKTNPVKDRAADNKTISNVVKTTNKPNAVQSVQDQLKVSGSASVGNKATAVITKATEEKIANNRAVAEEKSRVIELQKNIQKTIELKNNALTLGTPAIALAAAPAVPTSTNAPLAVTAATSPLKDVSPPAAGGMPKDHVKTTDLTLKELNKTVEPTAEVKKEALASAALPVIKPIDNAPAWFDDVDPLAIGGLGGIGLLLGGWFLYRKKRRSNSNSNEFGDSAFSSKSTQGTMLTGEGGQAVDTFNSVFVSSFSDANAPMESAEVDPIAEADVYMQYGRDAHAEDILKDALKQKPSRHSVRLKLMQLYASKQNHEALKTQFQEMSILTQPNDAERLAAQQIMNDSKENGLIEGAVPRINLSNPTKIGDVLLEDSILASQNVKGSLSVPISNNVASGSSMPIDLAIEMSKIEQPKIKVNEVTDTLDFDVKSRTAVFPQNTSPLFVPRAVPPAAETNSRIEFKSSMIDSNPASVFDKISGADTSNSIQAIETKFSLAQAYIDIGDKDGAKELLQEVLESGHQSLASQAKALLVKI